jgi:hypothetical protein
MFFDGRTLIIKRVHQINEHKISHSHLLRRLMIRFSITEMNSTSVEMDENIQTITMTTNEEFCLKQLTKEPNYPCRISVEVLFHVPYKCVDNDTMINRMNVSNTSILKSSSIPSKAFRAYKRFFSWKVYACIKKVQWEKFSLSITTHFVFMINFSFLDTNICFSYIFFCDVSSLIQCENVV